MIRLQRVYFGNKDGTTQTVDMCPDCVNGLSFDSALKSIELDLEQEVYGDTCDWCGEKLSTFDEILQRSFGDKKQDSED